MTATDAPITKQSIVFPTWDVVARWTRFEVTASDGYEIRVQRPSGWCVVARVGDRADANAAIDLVATDAIVLAPTEWIVRFEDGTPVVRTTSGNAGRTFGAIYERDPA